MDGCHKMYAIVLYMMYIPPIYTSCIDWLLNERIYSWIVIYYSINYAAMSLGIICICFVAANAVMLLSYWGDMYIRVVVGRFRSIG